MRSRRPNKTQISSACLAALLCLGAQAQTPAPLIYALHPLNVIEPKDASETQRLQEVFLAQTGKAGLHTADPACVAEVLSRLERHSCEADEACLADLGTQCHAQRVLWVNVVPNRAPTLFHLSGKIVRSDGLAGSNALEADVARSSNKAKGSRMGEAIYDFISRMAAMDFAPPTFLTSAAPLADRPGGGAPALATSVEPVSVTLSQPGHGMEVAGLVVGGVGVAALVTSGVVALLASSERSSLRNMLDAQGRRVPTAEAQSLANSLNTKSAIATASLIGGGVLVAGGAALLLVGIHQDSTVHIAFEPRQGGGWAALQGEF